MVRRKRDRFTVLISVLAVALAAAALTFYLWHLNETTRLGYDTSRLEEDISQLKEEVRLLETKKSELLSLERVERIAREKLRLTDPLPGQVRYENQPAEKPGPTKVSR